ncbi:iron-sulfur cofactor synthesis protein [Lactobacillus hamsteri DSM 5661 = JCM 6256]|uniref:Iron-sulfur cofactor synthesis protein n=2 Tax=Lactobacillus hamsteri TaxID=96565 RepID=A0A0R1Y549_9LACO|nr:iron-sulfur cofactor synthesis protein [Lactobacillus hamsteri DSM 5661 = JCM 6256]
MKIMNKRIYLDNAGTSPMAPEVVKTMTDMMTNVFGNASATNYYGREAKNVLEKSRHTIAQSINAQDNEIIFTSGGTESDNTAIMQTAMLRQNEGKHIISTKIEHEAVLKPLQRLEKMGFEVTYLDVDENGQINLDELKKAIRPDTILVTIMMINNEVGSLEPIKEIGEIVAPTNAWFHTDAVQAYGEVPIDVEDMKIDLLSTSAHKLNGPKLLGFLYERNGIDLPSYLQGGDQELKRRAGTENVPAIAGFAKAAEIHSNEAIETNREKYLGFKHALVDGLKENGIDFEVNGHIEENMAPQVINIWFKGIKSDVLLTNLDLSGIVGAAGSACTAGSLNPSHVLIAMYGEDNPRVYESLRFSFGIENTMEDIEQLVATLTKIIKRLKNR